MHCINAFFIIITFEFIITTSNEYENNSPSANMKSLCYIPAVASGMQHEKCSDLHGDQIEVSYVIGDKNGDVMMKFPLAAASCKVIGYKILLFVDEKCTRSRSVSPHSIKMYRSITCQNDSCPHTCEKYGQVYFHKLRSGCYKVSIEHLLGRSYVDKESKWEEIVTNYTEPQKVPILFENEYENQRQILIINLTLSFQTSDVSFTLKDKDGNIIETAGISKVSNHYGCHVEGKVITPSGLNLQKFDRLSYVFHNVTPDKYSLSVCAFNDEQCDPCDHSIQICGHENICLIEDEFSTKIFQDQITMMDNSWGLLMIVPAVLFLFLLIGIISYKCYKRHYMMTRITDYECELPFSQSLEINKIPAILLLYTRDCEPFMEAMKCLKELLEEICCVEVYDCYDHLNWDHEAITPQIWLERMFNQQLYIVIVSSYCAFLQHKFYVSGDNNAKANFYKEPSCLDNIFIYGLKYLEEYKINNSLQKRMFFIQLEGFSEGLSLNSYPTSSILYQLPLHFCKLFRDMALNDYEGNPEKKKSFENHKLYKKFLERLEILTAFKSCNGNYLDELLYLEL